MNKRGALILIVLALACVGCGFKYNLTDATSEVETALIEYTAQHAATLGVNVRGEITKNRPEGQVHVDATGWYQGGVAYYYQPHVEQHVSLVDGQCPSGVCELATGVAAHEVCHGWQVSKGYMPNHDTQHWCCMKNLKVRPTYDAPVKVMGQWPTCE